MRKRLRRLHANGRTFVWRAEIRHAAGARDCHRCIRVRAWGSAIIDYALARGWDADRAGGTFLLTERAHATAFSLDGFLLTDRLCDPHAPDPTERVLRALGQF